VQLDAGRIQRYLEDRFGGPVRVLSLSVLGPEPEHIDLGAFNEIIRTLRVEASPTLMDSQAKHAVIATGRADLLIRVPATKSFRDKIWDQTAGSLIIEEAGGQVTDLSGAPLDFGTGRLLTRNEGVIASNRLLHAAVLDAVRDVTTRP
jgi:3'-phosphoadenosine 5'-phosphosulfate (PAPS) 3'-phosphatase